jgi:hypothetical protein
LIGNTRGTRTAVPTPSRGARSAARTRWSRTGMVALTLARLYDRIVDIMTPVTSIAKFERFFRLAASVDVDKDDLKRYSDFVDRKTYDLLLRGQANAKANGRDIIAPFDLPITKGLQEDIHEFERIDEQIRLEPALDRMTGRPALDLAYDYATEAELPRIAGGLSVALARTFKILDPEMKNPQTAHWQRAFQIFDLLV